MHWPAALTLAVDGQGRVRHARGEENTVSARNTRHSDRSWGFTCPMEVRVQLDARLGLDGRIELKLLLVKMKSPLLGLGRIGGVSKSLTSQQVQCLPFFYHYLLLALFPHQREKKLAR